MITGNFANKKVLITGGAGTLGRALIAHSVADDTAVEWTVYSRDPVKQQQLRRDIPDANVKCVLGDILDYERLEMLMHGHDIVVHAAAQKHIPEGEAYPWDCVATNVLGSKNVALAAISAGVSQVVGISTDKVVNPINVYGNTKALMESIFSEYRENIAGTSFHLVRYGNVIGSAGSVLTVWRKQVERGIPVTVTSLEMTRFWMTAAQAVDLVDASLLCPSGTILIPLVPALDMHRFLEYTIGDTEIQEIGLRPGEKMHEALIGRHEFPYLRDASWLSSIMVALDKSAVATVSDNIAVINKHPYIHSGYTSLEPSRLLSRQELLDMVTADD